MVNIEKMTTRHIADVISLTVADEQRKFIGDIENILANANAQVRPHVITVGSELVGFFLIDTTFGRQHDFVTKPASSVVGLRSVFIDKQHQGKGFAKQALAQLPNYLSEAYPHHTHIYLTVNCQNPIAQKLYLSAGFQDTNELYHGGTAGPQHIMVRAIVSEPVAVTES